MSETEVQSIPSHIDILKFLYPAGIPNSQLDRLFAVQEAIENLIVVLGGEKQHKGYVRTIGPDSERLTQKAEVLRLASLRECQHANGKPVISKIVQKMREAGDLRVYYDQVKDICLSAEPVKCPIKADLPKDEENISDEVEKPEDKNPVQEKAYNPQVIRGQIFDMYVKEHVEIPEITQFLNDKGIMFSEEMVRSRLRQAGVEL